MAGSDITCSGLVAIDDVAGIKLQWIVTDTWPKDSHYSLDTVEVWAATANNRGHGSFAKIGEGRTDYSHAGLTRGETRYYWVRARNKIGSGSYGPWYPVSATAGVQGTELSGDVLLATNGYWKHPSGLIEQWGNELVVGSATVTFPIPFPTAAINIITIIGTLGYSNLFAGVSFTATPTVDFYLSVKNSAGVDQTEIVVWRALGY